MNWEDAPKIIDRLAAEVQSLRDEVTTLATVCREQGQQRKEDISDLNNVFNRVAATHGSQLTALEDKHTQLHEKVTRVQNDFDNAGVESKIAYARGEAKASLDNAKQSLVSQIDEAIYQTSLKWDTRADGLKREIEGLRAAVENNRQAQGDLADTVHSLLQDWARFKRVQESKQIQ